MSYFFDLKEKKRQIENEKTKKTYNTFRRHSMWEFILNTIFWTLALYGFFEVIKNIIYIGQYTKFKADGIYVIIAVKNQEEKIEGFLKSILFKILYGREEYLKNIIVADIQSTDNTKEIAKKLEEDYEILKVTSWKECKELIDNVEQIE